MLQWDNHYNFKVISLTETSKISYVSPGDNHITSSKEIEM